MSGGQEEAAPFLFPVRILSATAAAWQAFQQRCVGGIDATRPFLPTPPPCPTPFLLLVSAVPSKAELPSMTQFSSTMPMAEYCSWG